MPILKRVSDGAGDAGPRVEAIAYHEDGTYKGVIGDEPVVGCAMLVGSITARSYSSSDYWLTTPVLEILEAKKGYYYRFRTANSEYELYDWEYLDDMQKVTGGPTCPSPDPLPNEN